MGKLDQKQLPLIFVLGPSGAGKSQLGIWLADDLHLLHMEIDRWPKGDGIDLEGIRAEWNAYYLDGSITPLASLLRSRAAKADRAGTVLTFPGGLVLPHRGPRGVGPPHAHRALHPRQHLQRRPHAQAQAAHLR